jgi:hypothetical protein
MIYSISVKDGYITAHVSVLGAMFFAIAASRIYKQLAAIAPNESIVSGYSNDGHFTGPPASFVAIGDAVPEVYASVGLTLAILKNCLYSTVGVSDAFDNLPNSHILRGVHVSKEGTKVLGGGQWVHPILLETCSKRPQASTRHMANV